MKMSCYGLRREEGNCEDWGLICGEIRAESYSTHSATVTVGTVHAQGCGGG
jgi:hypothetical protein